MLGNGVVPMGARVDDLCKIAYSINNNRRLVTQFTFPPCKFFDAKGTVTATFEKLEAKKESLIPQLGVTICIGE